MLLRIFPCALLTAAVGSSCTGGAGTSGPKDGGSLAVPTTPSKAPSEPVADEFSELDRAVGFRVDPLDLAALCFLDNLRRLGMPNSGASTAALVEADNPDHRYFVVQASIQGLHVDRDWIKLAPGMEALFDDRVCPQPDRFKKQALVMFVQENGKGYDVVAGRAGAATAIKMGGTVTKAQAMKRAFELTETAVGAKLRYETRRSTVSPKVASYRCIDAWCDAAR